MTDFVKSLLKMSRITACFGALLLLTCVEIPEYAVINVKVSPPEGGTVSTNPSGPEYEIGTKITLTANPASGYAFKDWTGDVGDLSGTKKDVTFTVSGNKYDKYNEKTATANFVKVYTLTVNNNPTGGGKTTPDSTSGRTTTYTAGTQVAVTAAPNPGYRFDRWSGASTSTNPSVTITMDGSKVLTANYVRIYTLKIEVDAVCGTLEVTIDGNTVTPVGTINVDSGKVVNLRLTVNDGYRFTGWAGAPSSVDDTSDTSITFSMTEDMSLVAEIERLYTLTVYNYPNDGGRTTPDSTTTYNVGTQVAVTAVPNSGYRFSGWTGADTSTNQPVTITMDGSKVLTANYKKVDTLTTKVNPEEAGTVTTKVNPEEAGTVSPVRTTADRETKVSVTATANPRYRFDRWSGASTSTDTNVTITMERDTTLIANFVHTYTVTYRSEGHTSGKAPTDSHSPYIAKAEVTVRDVGTLIDTARTFAGWMDADGTLFQPGGVFTIIKDVVLSAKWELQDAKVIDD